MFILIVCAACAPLACVEIGPPELTVPIDFTLLGGGSQFVIGGTAAIVDDGGPCPVWIGDNGIVYHLFQDPILDNETFDRVTAPGTTSRLVLVIRGDLELACRFGTIAEVQDVLEIAD